MVMESLMSVRGEAGHANDYVDRSEAVQKVGQQIKKGGGTVFDTEITYKALFTIPRRTLDEQTPP